MTITAGEQVEIDHANASAATPILFVHGLWLLRGSWRGLARRRGEPGFVTLAPGWPDDPETVEEARAHPETFAGKGVGAGHRPLRRGHRRASTGSRWSIGALVRRPDHPEARGAGPGPGVGRDRPGAVPGRAPAAGLRAPGVLRGPRQPREPAARGDAEREAVPLRVRQRRLRGRVPRALRALRRAGRRAPAVPGRDGQPAPRDRGERGHRAPRARAAADHLRRARPHRAVGDRERVVQEAGPQPEPDRDHRDRRARATRWSSTTAGRRWPTRRSASWPRTASPPASPAERAGSAPDPFVAPGRTAPAARPGPGAPSRRRSPTRTPDADPVARRHAGRVGDVRQPDAGADGLAPRRAGDLADRRPVAEHQLAAPQHRRRGRRRRTTPAAAGARARGPSSHAPRGRGSRRRCAACRRTAARPRPARGPG